MNLQNDETLTISRIAPALRRRELSPVELTRWILSRAERFQPRLNAFITITADLALKAARQAETAIARGDYRGPLHGIPLSLKDLICTKGVRTTAGSRILGRFLPGKDARVTGLLRRRGAVLVGKTNLHEFAYGATNLNVHYGPVLNPWNSGRMSGGSSGGSAASVVAALSLASVGTDTGGSIRIPASACGCVGLKPTYGSISSEGVIPLSTSLDHVGPLARCVEDAATLFCELANPRNGQVRSVVRQLKKGVRDLRIGIPRQYFFDNVSPEIRRAVLAASNILEELGAEIREVRLEGTEDTAYLSGIIPLAEALAYHWDWLEQQPGDYDPVIRARLEAGKAIPAAEYLRALDRQRTYALRFEKVFETVDLIVAPSLPVTAPRLDQKEIALGKWREDVRLALLRLTRPSNLTGQPALSLPCGFAKDGMPIGLQIIGRRWDEAVVLRAAYAYEQATPWHKKFPPET